MAAGDLVHRNSLFGSEVEFTKRSTLKCNREEDLWAKLRRGTRPTELVAGNP